MMKFFFQCSKRVDYGEQELCAELSLLQRGDYQEYLSQEAPFYPLPNQEVTSEPAR